MDILPSISWIFLYSISNLRGEYEEGCDFLQITSLTRLMRLTSDILFKHSIKSKSKKSPFKSGIRSCRVNHISFTIIAVWVAMTLILFSSLGQRTDVKQSGQQFIAAFLEVGERVDLVPELSFQMPAKRTLFCSW